MRRANGLLRQQRRNSCQPSTLLLFPAALLVLLALFSVTKSGIFSAEQHGEPIRAESQGKPGESVGSLSHYDRSTIVLPRAAGLSDLATRHNSMKLETLQEMEYPLPVPLRSPPASQQMGGTLQPPPRELTADQVKPLDMAKASLALRPQVQVRPQDMQRNRPDFPLVIYVLLESNDPENEANFMYYVREAIREHDGCTHLILVDQRRDMKALPRLPVENAKYVKRRSKACLWGGLGDLLRSPEVDLSKFTSFVMLTSRLRGPFLPAYLQSTGMPWASLLTAKLNNRTRLVGPVITCQDISWPDTIPEAERRRAQPFLPQHMLVADQVGLQLLLDDGQVFRCHGSEVPAPERFSAHKAAQVILQAGYNLDSLMQRYQGVQWSEKENWGCNAELEANGGENYYDGISVHPMEVMFVEVTGLMLRKGLSTAKAAKKYDKWKSAQALLAEDLTFNMYAFDPMLFRAAGIAYMEKRGPGCFDFGYYAQNNPELSTWPIDEQWFHFVQSGQFEDRLYRFNCVDLQARSFNCFDTNYYNRANEDLNKLRLEGRPLPPREAWSHFLRNGFFEQRAYRFMDICGEDLDSPNNLGEGT